MIFQEIQLKIELVISGLISQVIREGSGMKDWMRAAEPCYSLCMLSPPLISKTMPVE